MKLEAQHNYVVVLVDKSEEHQHVSGLTITSQSKEFERNPYGRIISVGPECKIPEFEIGTHVLIPPVGGVEYLVGNDRYLILLDHEIYGVLND